MFGKNKKNAADPGTDEQSDDPYAWRKEFEFTDDEIAQRGEPVGHMRFVAFQPADDTKLSMMSNVNIDDDFTKAMVNHLAENDEEFEYFKRLISMAEMYRDLENGDIGSILGRVFGGGRPGRSPFPSGGFGGGEMGGLRELLGMPQRRMNQIESILESLGERRGRPRIEAHVIGIGKRPGQSIADAIREAMGKTSDSPHGIDGLMEALRKATGGEGCDCPRCTELRRKMAEDKQPGTDAPTDGTADKREDDPERNGTE